MFLFFSHSDTDNEMQEQESKVEENVHLAPYGRTPSWKIIDGDDDAAKHRLLFHTAEQQKVYAPRANKFARGKMREEERIYVPITIVHWRTGVS